MKARFVLLTALTVLFFISCKDPKQETVETHYESGAVKTKTEPDRNHRQKVTAYYENGHEKSVVYLDSIGNNTGLARYYYKDGKLHKEINFVKGKYHGLYRVTDENGKVTYEALYHTGKVDKMKIDSIQQP